jgi:hypothetical protein
MYLKINDSCYAKSNVMPSIPEAGAKRNDYKSGAIVMLSDSEASRNQSKRVEPSPYGFPILADSSLPLRMTHFWLNVSNSNKLLKRKTQDSFTL